MDKKKEKPSEKEFYKRIKLLGEGSFGNSNYFCFIIFKGKAYLV